MQRICRVDIAARGKIVARAVVLPGGAPSLEVVEGTRDDVRLVQAQACGEGNVITLDAQSLFRQIVDAFPPTLASAFGAYTAVPCYE